MLVAQLVQHVRSVDAGVVAQLLRDDLERDRILGNSNRENGDED